MRRSALLITVPALVLALTAGGGLTGARARSAASPGAARTVALSLRHLDPPTCC
jgi:hypothetical protein